MRKLVIFCFFLSSYSYASGWSVAAVPERVDVVRANGLLVWGAFGNASNCTISNRYFIKLDHPQYKEIYSMVLTAYLTGKKIKIYSNTCESLTWYSVPETTYNTLTAGGSVNLY